MITTTQQIKVSDAQIEQLKRSIKHSELVEHEIVALPDSTRLYEGVGRM
jgi:prefoldin subunit 1